MPNQNLVSIVLPVYNASSYLATCLNSLLNQTYKDIEVIVIDDFSRDDSYTILKQFKKKDKRLRVYRNKKRYGSSVSLNRAVRKARGAYIAFMDAHDRSNLNRVKRQLNYLKENSKLAAVGTQCFVIGKKDEKIEKSLYPSDVEMVKQGFAGDHSLQFETLMINRTRIPKDLLRFTSDAYPFIYTEVVLKLLQYGTIANMQQYLYYHRQVTKKTYAKLDSFEKLLSNGRLWVKTLGNTETRPAMKNLFPSLLPQLKLSK